MSFKQQALMVPGLITGFITAQDPKTLAPNTAGLLQNIRLGSSEPTARDGDVLIADMITGGCRGAVVETLDGVQSIYRAAYLTDPPAGVGVQISTDDGANFSEITSPSVGPFGITRFTGDVTQPIRFCVIRDRGYDPNDVLYDLLVIQNGTEAPRLYGQAVYNSSATTPGDFLMSTINQPDQPVDSVDLPYTASLGHFWDIASATETVVGATGIAISKDTAPTGQITVSIDSTYTGGTVTASFPVDLDVSGCPQIILLVLNGSDQFWQSITTEVSANGTDWFTLTSPGQNVNNINLELTTPNGLAGTLYQIAVPVDPEAAVGVDFSALDRLRFTWSGLDYPTGATTFFGTLYAVIGSGTTPGGAQFAAAYGQTDSRTIGPSIVKQFESLPYSQSYGSATNITVPIQDDQRFFFDYSLTVQNPSAPQAALGIDRVHVYRRLPGGNAYYWIGSQALTTYSGSGDVWNYITGAAGDPVTVTIPQGDSSIEDLRVTAPAADTLCLPVGLAMTTVNGRGWVGSGALLYFSDFQFPFMYRKSVAFDAAGPIATSGGSMAFDGDIVQALVPLGALAGGAENLNSPIIGSAVVHILTMHNLWRVSGFDATSISHPIPVCPYGTLSPMSVGRSYLGFYWFDQTGQICRWTPEGLFRPSVSKVDDLLATITAEQRPWSWGVCYNDRYYLAFGDGGAGVLVWYERTNAWESFDQQVDEDDFTVAFAPYYLDGQLAIYQFAPQRLNQYEQPGNTNTVPLYITLRGVHADGLQRISVGEVSVWVDAPPVDADPYTVTVSKKDLLTGVSVGGDILVDSQQVWVEPVGTGFDSSAYQVTVTGIIPGGTHFHAILVKTELQDSGETRND